MSTLRTIVLCLLVLCAGGMLFAQDGSQNPVKVTSPNGQISVLLFEAGMPSGGPVRGRMAPADDLRYVVEFHGKRLMESARLALDEPELSYFVLHKFADWKDWSVQEKLRKLYESENYSDPSIQKEIVRYMIASTKDVPVGVGENPGKHVTDGTRFLEELRELDPKIVKEAEKQFALDSGTIKEDADLE